MGASIYPCIYYTTKKDRFRVFSRWASCARSIRAHLDTTTGPRAVLGSQQPPTRSGAQANSTPVPQSDALRAEDPPSLKSGYGGAGGSRSVPFGHSSVLVVVSRGTLSVLFAHCF